MFLRLGRRLEARSRGANFLPLPPRTFAMFASYLAKILSFFVLLRSHLFCGGLSRFRRVGDGPAPTELKRSPSPTIAPALSVGTILAAFPILVRNLEALSLCHFRRRCTLGRYKIGIKAVRFGPPPLASGGSCALNTAPARAIFASLG